ncbi:phage antirepressor KilAC domain-containing protein [Clostridium perfringens]|uniref:phage antirepressor KilAC domain-containing protein n=2 Tax=Clostridium perfringens TaxID=1502 RepID=UPI00374A5911
MGVQIPVIEGGFGEKQKVILAKDIAGIHSLQPKRVNELINNNLDEFEFGVDILDLKQVGSKDLFLESGLFTKAQWGNAKNIYILSEQGYMLLVGFMKTDKAKEIRKQLRREYFAMREIINSDEELKKQLLLKLYNGGIDSIEAHKRLSEIEVSKAKEEVVVKLQDKVNFAELMTDKNNCYDVGTVAKAIGVKGVGRNKLFEFLRDEKILMYNNEPYQAYTDKFKVIMVTNKKSGHMSSKTLANGKGVKLIYKRLVDNGYIIRKTKEQILLELDHSEEVV